MSLDAQMALLDELPAAHLSPSTPLVPDTNALIADPDLEHWVRAIATSKPKRGSSSYLL